MVYDSMVFDVVEEDRKYKALAMTANGAVYFYLDEKIESNQLISFYTNGELTKSDPAICNIVTKYEPITEVDGVGTEETMANILEGTSPEESPSSAGDVMY